METYFEVFDKVLEEVQQLRLDTNHFVKSSLSIDQRILKVRNMCKKYEMLLLRKPSEKLRKRVLKYHNVMRKLMYNNHTNITTFKNIICSLKRKCENFCRDSGFSFDFSKKYPLNANCIVNARDGINLDLLYCKCNQPAFKNMIACSSSSCKIGWFHCECVNVTSSLKTSWICSECKKKAELS